MTHFGIAPRSRTKLADQTRARLPSAVGAGVLATVTMDAAMVAAGRLGGTAFVSDRLSIEMIGRWAAGLARGRWRHADIRSGPARRGETCLGLATHYATGIALTQAFLLLPRHGNRPPVFRSGLAFGIATAVLPLLLMFPSMGYGPFGLRTGDAARLGRIMLVGHVGFGIGIGLWAPRSKERGTGGGAGRGVARAAASGVEPDR